MMIVITTTMTLTCSCFFFFFNVFPLAGSCHVRVVWEIVTFGLYVLRDTEIVAK